jgi:pimeloyl-ACP methyl ester carboxylesterase
MRSDHVLGLSSRGFHHMRYYEWGDPANPRLVVCVHGLTRTGRDFDVLAEALSPSFRVVCPDIVGRGQSDWLDAKQDYNYAQYMADLTVLLAKVNGNSQNKIDWVGTSMGGLLGIIVASTKNNPIRKLVVNDAGMLVPKAALARLALYVGKDPRFPTVDALEDHVRRISAPFGPLTDAQWRHLTIHCARQHADGTWGFCYDPAIANALAGEISDIDLTAFWDAVKCPTLLLRGSESDILSADTAHAMTQRGPRAILREFAGIGHAPMLMSDDQVASVKDFLLDR